MSEVNFKINQKYDNKINSSEQVAPSQTTPSTPETVPIGKKVHVWETLGLTQDQYLAICTQNPDFQNLPQEEQIKFIQALAAANKKTDPANVSPEKSDTTPVNSENVKGGTSPTELSDTSAPNSAKKVLPDTLAKERQNFKNSNINQKISIIINSAAKNSYIYGEPRHTEEEWNALSDKERNSLVKTAEKQVEEAISKMDIDGVQDIKDLKKFVIDKGGRDVAKNILDKFYTSIQVANKQGLSVAFYAQLSVEDKDNFTYSYINEIYDSMESKDADALLNDYEKSFYGESKTFMDAVKYHQKQTTGSDYTNMCLDDAKSYVENSGVSKAALLKNYYEAKVEEYVLMSSDDKKALSDADKQAYEEMSAQLEEMKKFANSKIGREYLGKNNVKKPDPPSILDKLSAKDVTNSMQDDDILTIVELGLSRKSKKAASQLSACIQSAIADGDYLLAQKLYSMGMEKYPKQFGNLIETDAALSVAAVNSGDASDEQLQVINDKFENHQNSDIAQAGLTTVRDNTATSKDPTQSIKVAKMQIHSRYQSARKGVVDVRNQAQTPKIQDEVDKIICDEGDIPARTHAIQTSDKLDVSNQNKSLERQLSDNKPELIRAATNMPSKMVDSAGAGEIVYNAVERVEDEATRIELKNSLADDVVNYKSADAQLKMHNLLMTAKEQEVLEHASLNINKYDKSVQADAIRASYNTGNQKAIDAVNAQLDLCDKAAVDSVVEVSEMLARTEKSSNEQVVKMVADLNSDYKSVTGNDIEVYDTEGSLVNIVSAFKTAVENNDTQRQIQLLGKIPRNMLSSAISQISMYNVNLLSTFVKLGRGSELLKIPGMSSDLTSKVIHLMLNSSMKDQKYAAKYVMDNKNYFAKSTLERCQKLLDGSSVYSSTPIGGVKTTLQPEMSAIYPNKKELFFKA